MIVGDPVERARELLTFAEGFLAAGGGDEELAQRARAVARDALELAGELAAEQSARVAVQARAEELQAIIGKRADEYLRRLT